MRRPFFYYLVALIGSIVLGRLRPGFVSVMIFYMLLLLLVAEILMMAMTYFSFRVSHSINKSSIVKGEKVTYELAFVNPSFFVFTPLKVHYMGSEVLYRQSELNHKNTLLLYPFSREQFQKKIQCDYRGSYTIGVERVEILGFFGLFSVSFKGLESLKILVYPTIHKLKAVKFHHAISETTESIVSFDKFDKSLFSEFRAYQPGDPLNKIHWKLSAKSEQLISKEYEGNVNNKTMLFINTELNDFGFEENIVIEDYLIEGAVALSKFLLKNNTPTELFWYGYEGHHVRGNHEKDFKEFYNTLATMEFKAQKDTCQQLLVKETGGQYNQCVLVVFTGKMTPSLCEVLLKKKGQGYQVNLVTLPMNNLEIDGVGVHVEGDNTLVYRLIDKGIRVYRLIFDKDTCRMEVA